MKPCPTDRTGQAWVHHTGVVLLVVGRSEAKAGWWDAVWLDSLERVEVSEAGFREDESPAKRKAYALTKVWG